MSWVLRVCTSPESVALCNANQEAREQVIVDLLAEFGDDDHSTLAGLPLTGTTLLSIAAT